MLHRKFLSAGIVLLSLFSSAAFGQTHIKENAASPTDSIVVELPNNTKMILVLDDIRKLKLLEKTNLDSLVRALNGQLQVKSPPAKSNPVEGNSIAIKANAESTDQLVLMATVGAGLIRNQVVPQLAPRVEARLKNKSYFVDYDMNYFFDRSPEGKYKMYINSFLDIGIGFKSKTGLFSSSSAPGHYQRVSAGYLVQQRGGYFERSTFRLSYSYPILNNDLKITTHLYFTDNFRFVFPGVSLRF